MGSGAIIQSGAFTDVSGDRTLTVGTADDPNAILGMEGLDDTVTDNVFTNKTSFRMDITLDAAPYEDESQIEWDVDDPVTDSDNDANPLTFSLNAGDDATVAVKGDDRVTFDGVAVLKDNGTAVGRIEVTRTIDVPVINNLELSGSVSSSGQSGKFDFTLENTGDVDVELRKVGIIETTTTAEYVDGGGSLLNLDTNTEYVTDRIPIDNSTSDSTQKVMDPKPVLDHQSNDGDNDSKTITFQLKKFTDPDSNGSSNVDMQSQDIKIQLTVKNLNDGSIVDAPVDLCSGTCGF